MWSPTGKFLAFWQLVSFPTTLFWGLFVKACFQALSFKNVQSPTRSVTFQTDWSWCNDRLTKDCHMHRLWEWFYTHSTVYFSPIKNKLVSVANWRPSYTWAVETVTAVHTSSPVSFITHQKLISISHWLKLRPSQCSTHMLEFCFNCSVSFVTLDCYNHVTLSKQIDHFNLNQAPKYKKLSPRALIRICFKTVSNI